MERSKRVRFVVGLLVIGGLIAVGCKKDEDPASVPVPSQSAAATPPPAPTTTEDPDAGAPETPSATPNTNPQPVVTTTVPKKQESIDACCSALRAVQKSGKTAIAKSKAAAAAGVCPGIAKLVKDGTTSRSAGLAQIRSSLTGFAVPPECQ